MPADSTIRLQVVTTADTAGIDKATQATEKLEQATAKSGSSAAASVSAQTKAVENADRAQSNFRTSTGNSTQSMQAFARMMQDGGSQINNGFNAVLNATSNNLEQLLGPKMVVWASGITVAVTALSLAAEHFDIFGSKAAAAVDETNKLSKAAAESAAEAKKIATNNAEATESEQARLESINAVTEAYNKQTEAIKRNNAERIRAAATEAKLAGEVGKGEDLDIDAQVATGEITEREGARLKEERRRKGAAESNRRRGLDAGRDFNAQQAQAQAAEQQAQRIGGQINNLDNASQGIMSADERKAAQEAVKQKKAELDAIAAQRKDLERTFNTTSGPEAAAIKADLDRKEKLLNEEIERKKSELAANDAAVRRIGKGATKESVQSERESLEKERKEALKTAEEARRKAQEIDRAEKDAQRIADAEEVNNRKAFEVKDFGMAGRERKEYDAKLQKERDEAERKRNRAAGEAGQSASALAGMGRAAGMSEKSLTEMERLGNKVAAGDTSSGVLNALDSLLAAFGKSAAANKAMVGKIAKMEKELEEATAALATLKEGH